MEARIENVFAEALREIDEGAVVSDEWIESNWPDHADDVREFLALHVQLSSARPKSRRVGRYVLEGRIGQGGVGTVYAGIVAQGGDDFEEGELVAVKLVHEHLLSRSHTVERLMREARLGRAVDHPGVVRTLDAGMEQRPDGTDLYLVTEYVEGRTLRGLLAERGTIPEALCLHVAKQVAAALLAVHAAGIVHRDVKPDNVLIAADGTAKLMDLGAALPAEELQRLSETGQFCGTLLYAAPEQLQGTRGDIDGRADLYSLGVTLVELATGRHPSAGLGEAPLGILHDPWRALPESDRPSAFFVALVDTLRALAPERRLSSAAELLSVLEQREESEWWRGRTRAALPPARVPVSRPTPLHGRDEGLATLEGAFRRAESGRGSVILVRGEPGMGKTRFLDEFVQRRIDAGERFHFLYGTHAPSRDGPDPDPFSAAFLRTIESLDSTDSLQRHPAFAPNALPSVLAMLRGERYAPGRTSFTIEGRRRLLAIAMEALSKDLPTLLCVDDLQWATDETLELFRELASRVPGNRVLLIGAGRHPGHGDWAERLEAGAAAAAIDLGPLPLGPLTDVIRDRFSSAEIASAVGESLHRASGGSPYFAHEILDRLVGDGRVRATPEGRHVLALGTEGLELPASALEHITARVLDLEPVPRQILFTAACCGATFDPYLVAETVGLGELVTLEHLDDLARSTRFLRPSDRLYAFDHHLAHEAVHAALDEDSRQEIHARIAERLEERMVGSGRPSEELSATEAATLVDHWIRADRPADALRHLTTAVARLRDAFQYSQAVSLLDRVLAFPDVVGDQQRFRLVFGKAGIFRLLGRPDDWFATLEEVMPLADRIGDPTLMARVRSELGMHLRYRGELEDAERTLRRAAELAAQSGNETLQARVDGNLAYFLLDAERHAEAFALIRPTIQRLRASNDLGALGTVVGLLGQLELDAGRLGAARKLWEEPLELSRSAGDMRREAYAHGNLAALDFNAGFFADALARIDEAQRLARISGCPLAECSLASIRAAVLTGTGEWGDGLRWARQSAEVAERIAEQGVVTLGHLIRAECESHLGDTAAARARLERVAEETMARGPTGFASLVQIELAALDLADGRLKRAHARLLEVEDRAAAVGNPRWRLTCLARMAELHHFMESLDTDAEWLRQLIQHGADTEFPALQAASVVFRVATSPSTASDALDAWSRWRPRLWLRTAFALALVLRDLTGDDTPVRDIRPLLQEALGRLAPDTRDRAIRAQPRLRAVVGDPDA